jgi:hypothetical protein
MAPEWYLPQAVEYKRLAVSRNIAIQTIQLIIRTFHHHYQSQLHHQQPNHHHKHAVHRHHLLHENCHLTLGTACVAHLAATGGSCAAAAVEGGVNPVADLACIGSAASTAAQYEDCKPCIPQ